MTAFNVTLIFPESVLPDPCSLHQQKSNLESVLKKGSTEMFLWRFVHRVCPDVTHKVMDWSHCSELSVILHPRVMARGRFHTEWLHCEVDIFIHNECLFYLVLSAVMVQPVCSRTQRYQHLYQYLSNFTPLWTLTERSSEFCMLYIGKPIYLSNAVIITAVNRNALIMRSESETQKLEWRDRARALHDYSELEFQRRSNVYSS